MVGPTHDLLMTTRGQILRAAFVVASRNHWLIKQRSKWLRSRGDAAGALALIDRAATAAPLDERLTCERVRVLGDLAEIRWAAGDADGAFAAFDQVLGVASQDERVIRRRAEMCARFAKRGRRAEGNAASALTLIDQALFARPDDPGLLVARASMLHALAQYQDAMAAWRRLADLAPVDVRGWVGMASALYMTDRAERIAPLIEEYLRVLGERPERYVRAAHVAMAGRQSSIFETLLAHARTEARRHPGTLRELAELHVKAGGVGEALNCLDEAHECARLDDACLTKRRKILQALRTAGIDAETLSPPQRVGLRMPDLALLNLLRRAAKPDQAAPGGVTIVCSSLGSGGAQRQILNTLRGLSALDSRRATTVMPLQDGDPALHRFHGPSLLSLAVTIAPCPGASVDMARLRAALAADVEDLLNLLPEALRADIGVLTSRFLKDPPEVVHAWGDRQNVAAGVAAVLAGVPRIVLSDRSVAPAGSRMVPAYYRAIYAGLLEHPSTILVNNSAAGARTYARWLGIDPARIRVVYNGVEFGELERARNPEATAAHRAQLGLPANAKVVGSLFRLCREKRPLLWLEAAAEVARRCCEAHFVIVGEGPLRREMAMAAAELGIADRLHMPGLNRDVAPWYDLMDVVLLTSRYEGTSNTALEAQALGKPVVSPAVGGMPETFVPGTSGFLVSADPAPVEVAECVTRALTDTAWRHAAERAARSFVRKRYSIERMVADTLELYGFAGCGPPEIGTKSPVEPNSGPH